MWDEERVEAAIDEAARQMTAGEPGADLRVRVMARIEAGSGLGARISAFKSWRPALAGLSFAALILLALFVSREQSRFDSPGRQLNPVATSVPVAAPRPPDTRLEVRLKPDATYGPAVRLKPDPTYEMDRPSEVDALALPSIELESIAVATLAAAESIHIEPLQAAAPIAVAPLSTENEGDPR
jgi:hypothetical protein